MTVTPISITQPFPIVRDGEPLQMTAQDLIVYCARVSNPSNQLNTETAPKLIRYCLLSDPPHLSIFQMVDVTFEIVTSRSISAQLLRHWSFSFQEFSTRYATVTAAEPITLRLQSKSNRQSSSEPMNRSDLDARVQAHVEASFALYRDLLAEGAARETARDVLPLAARTTLYMKGTLRSWLTYLSVRLDAHTQAEHQQLAREVAKHLRIHFPDVAEATEDFGHDRGNFM